MLVERTSEGGGLRRNMIPPDFDTTMTAATIRSSIGVCQANDATAVVEGPPQTEDRLFGSHRFLARVIAHEVDHLNGILYVDRMRDSSSIKEVDLFDRD